MTGWLDDGNNGWVCDIDREHELRVWHTPTSDLPGRPWLFGIGSPQSGEVLTWKYAVGCAPDIASAQRHALEVWEAGPYQPAPDGTDIDKLECTTIDGRWLH